MALTIRLSEEEIQELEKIGEVLNIGTSSGTIKSIITKYMSLTADLQNTKSIINDMKEERTKIATLIHKKQTAKKTIANMNSQLARWAVKHEKVPY